jgi:hypothetical protein
MWHLLVLPFILLAFVISGATAAAGVALFSVFLIPLILLALLFRIGFFFLKIALVVGLGCFLLASCI